MRTLYHGSRVTVEQPEIRIQKFHKDFYWGFYCTEYETQAARWATRFGSGIVNVYQFEEQPGLSVKRFPEMSDEWLDFIVACRFNVFDAHPYPYGFGCDREDMWKFDPTEPVALVKMMNGGTF